MAEFERVTLRQILYFLSVADHGSLRRAANHLEVTQPTLTAQIAALEETLGLKLFERTRSGSTLSVMARELLPNARQVIEEARGFRDRADSLAGGTAGTYRLGVTPTLGPYLMPTLLPELHREYADLKLYVREAPPIDLEEDLKNAQHDLILTTEPVTSRNLSIAPLFREPLKLAIAREHRLASKARINRSDLFAEEVLTMGEHHLFHRQILELCERIGASVRRDYEGTSLDTLRQMVLMNMGLAFLPALYIRSEIRDREEFRIAEVHGMSVFRSHSLVWRPASPSRGTFRDLADRIRSIAAEKLGDDVVMLRA